jgi:hypothetical protein
MGNIVRFPGSDPRRDPPANDQAEGHYIDQEPRRSRGPGVLRSILFHTLLWLHPLLTAPLRAGAAVGLIVFPVGLWWTWDAHQEYRAGVWIIAGIGLACSALAWGYESILYRLNPDDC